MKKNFITSLALILLILTTYSCKSKKELVKSKPTTETGPMESTSKTEASIFRKKALSEQFDFKTLSIKAKADLNINNNKNNVSMTLRLRKDEAIWVSVTALAGLEVARALITPDSIKVLNRLQEIYMAKPFSYIYRFTNRKIDFKAVQAILLGNPFPGTINDSTAIQVSGSDTHMNGKMESLVYTLIFNSMNKLTFNHVKDSIHGQTMEVTYGNFEAVSGTRLASEVHLKTAAGRQAVAIGLKYTSVTINEPVEFPFSIPKRFTKMD